MSNIDTELNTWNALLLVLPAHRVSVDLLKEVNHEATILAKLSCLGSQEGRGDTHINLCRLLGVMVDIPFLQYSLVLEYCAGGELYQLLHKRKV